jgi:CRP-like cAMP-binding protein
VLSDRIGSRLERVVELDDGERVVAEGDPGAEMFIVLEGRIRISKATEGDGRVELAELGRGQFFGEMSVLESAPRDADVHAVGKVRLLAIGQGSLLVRLRRDPSFALELLHQLSKRVRVLNERVSELEGRGLEVQGDR